MKTHSILGLAACVVVLVCGLVQAAETDLRASAKAVAAQAAVVVPIKITSSIKVTYNGREMPSQETAIEVLGTVLDDSGLIVTSNIAADPASQQQSGRPGMTVESEIKSAKLVQKDGTEVALKIVLRDKDLDLMFVRPEAKTALPNLGAKKEGAKLELADDVIVLSRLGAVGDRQPSVTLTRVEAVVDKPRRFYVTGLLDTMVALGCPAFNTRGELVGIVVMRINHDAAAGGMLAGIGSRILPAILPVADVVEDMGQIEKPQQ